MFKFIKANEKELKKASQNPLVYELRKRINAYYKLVVRNLRDLVPKQVFNFLIIKCMRELEFEAFQFTSDPEKLKDWLNEVGFHLFSLLKLEQEEWNASRLLRCLISQKSVSEWIPISRSLSEHQRKSLNM
jgi:hypothetical protein